MSTRNIFELIFAGSLLLLPKPYAVSASGMCWFSSLLYKFATCNLLFCTFGTFGIIMAGVVFFHGKHIFKTDLKTDVLKKSVRLIPKSKRCSVQQKCMCSVLKVSFKNIALGPARGIL